MSKIADKIRALEEKLREKRRIAKSQSPLNVADEFELGNMKFVVTAVLSRNRFHIKRVK